VREGGRRAKRSKKGPLDAKKRAKKSKKYTATGLPMWSPTIVLTGLDHA
jgi:hypothetical protein